MKKTKFHTSQIAGPSKNNLQLLYDYSSDSAVEEQSKDTIDYDNMYPPSPKISKGGTIKKSKVSQTTENMSKKDEELLLDVDSTASCIDDTDSSKSKGQHIYAYDSDIPAEMPTAKIKDTINNADELSSDVDIAPSGIVAQGNSKLQCTIINSDCDEGNGKIQGKSYGEVGQKGK